MDVSLTWSTLLLARANTNPDLVIQTPMLGVVLKGFCLCNKVLMSVDLKTMEWVREADPITQIL